MSQRNKWPTKAKIVFAVLAIVFVVIAALRTPETNTHVVTDPAPATQPSPSTSVPQSPAPSETTPVPTTSLPSPQHKTNPTTIVPRTQPTPTPQAPAPTQTRPASPPPNSTQSQASSERSMLESLPVTTLDFTHDYDRSVDFGTAWTDDNDNLWGHNGCDTRNDILKRDLRNVVFRPGTHDCVVISGTFIEPYSGQPFSFVKAQASKVQIDHIVPLHAAWQLGAWRWTREQRINYANDPVVLLAVSGSLNMSKGDDLANEWLPPNRAYYCTYASKTVAIHVKYRLGVTSGEKATLLNILRSC